MEMIPAASVNSSGRPEKRAAGARHSIGSDGPDLRAVIPLVFGTTFDSLITNSLIGDGRFTVYADPSKPLPGSNPRAISDAWTTRAEVAGQ